MFGNSEKIPKNENIKKKPAIENPEHDQNKNVYTGDVDEAMRKAGELHLADSEEIIKNPVSPATKEASNDSKFDNENIGAEADALELATDSDDNEGDPYNSVGRVA